MSAIKDLATIYFYGSPASAGHAPSKTDGMAVFQQIDSVVSAYMSSGGLVYLDRSGLYADLAHTANSMAWVVSDTTASYNGIYMKSGASGAGSWSRVADLPYSIVYAVDSGAGTENAIIAVPNSPISVSSLVIVVASKTSTVSGPTISFDGGVTNVPILTASGSTIYGGGIVSGMPMMGRYTPSEFRLYSEQATSAILTAAQDWASSAGRVLQLQSTSVGWWQLERALKDAGWIDYLTVALPPTDESIGQVISRNLTVTPGDTFTVWMTGVLKAALGWSDPDASSHIASLFSSASIKNLGAPTVAIDPSAINVSRSEFQGLSNLAVRVDPQSLSSGEKSQARTNIGLGSVATQSAASVALTGGSITGITDLAIADGGTGASTAAAARANLGAASSGANADVTSLTGLTTPLSVVQGGTGAATASGARSNLGIGAISLASSHVSITDLGAVGDGSDESTIIQAAANAAAGKKLYFPPGSWRCSGIELPSNIVVEFAPGAVVTQATSATSVFNANGSIGSPIALTSDVAVGSMSITVSTAYGLAVGDWLIIYDTYGYSYRGDAAGYCSGESIRIASISGATIYLESPLLGAMTSDKAYTVSNGAAIVKVNKKTNIRLTGYGSIVLLQETNTNGFLCRYVDKLNIEGISISHTAGTCAFIRDSTRFFVDEVNFEDGLDDVANGHPGYGVAIGGASDVWEIRSGRYRGLRHAVTTIGGATGGPTRGRIAGVQAYQCSNVAIDTHEAGRQIVIEQNKIIGSKDGGINSRTGHTTIRGNDIQDVLGTGIGAIASYLEHLTIESNIMRNVGTYGITISGSCNYLEIRRNTLKNVAWHGISFGGMASSGAFPATGIKVIGNNLYSIGTVLSPKNAIYYGGDVSSEVDIRDNNIEVGSGSIDYGIYLAAPVTGNCENNRVIGTPNADAYSLNGLANFNNSDSARKRRQFFTLTTDSVATLPFFSGMEMIVMIGASSAGTGYPNGLFRARPNSSPQCAAITTFASNVAFSTTALTGTTGTSGYTTISATNGYLWIENRTGGSVTYWIEISGAI